jgi:hypothetical protein
VDGAWPSARPVDNPYRAETPGGILTLVKLRHETVMLKSKALGSLRRAVRSFNDLDDDGRASTVLLHLQHAFEMLLKAGLVQVGAKVFDKRDGRSIGFERCLNLGREHLALSDEETGTLRAIDALRDDEQHWLTQCSEGGIDRALHRVAPPSAEPPGPDPRTAGGSFRCRRDSGWQCLRHAAARRSPELNYGQHGVRKGCRLAF